MRNILGTLCLLNMVALIRNYALRYVIHRTTQYNRVPYNEVLLYLLMYSPNLEGAWLARLWKQAFTTIKISLTPQPPPPIAILFWKPWMRPHWVIDCVLEGRAVQTLMESNWSRRGQRWGFDAIFSGVSLMMWSRIFRNLSVSKSVKHWNWIDYLSFGASSVACSHQYSYRPY